MRLGARALSDLEAAPVAEAPAAAAPVAEAAPAEASPEPSEAAPAEAPVAAEPAFDYADWKGEIENLPEDHRTAASGVSEYYKRLIEDQSQETIRMQELYEALMSGEEDPRVAKLTTERDELKTKVDSHQTDFDAYKQQVDEYQTNQANEFARQFIQRHKSVLSSEENRKSFRDLIGKGWNEEMAIKLIGMPAASVKVATDAKSEGVPDSYAIKMAELQAGTRALPAARDGARITSGATTSTSRPSTATNSVSDARTLNEARKIAVAKAIRSARG